MLAQLGERGVRLGGHAGRQAQAVSFLQAGCRPAAVGQRGDRATGTLAFKQLVHKRNGNGKPTGYLANRELIGRVGSYNALAQIIRISVYNARYIEKLYIDSEMNCVERSRFRQRF